MRHLRFIAALLGTLLFHCPTHAQEPTPDMLLEVPNRMELGGVQLKLTDEVREKIGSYAARLMENNYYFRKKVERADAYFPIIERILEEEGVPTDFKYLVLQESGLVSDVVSSSNAVGFWQFKKATAMEVGLRIDGEMDERKNIASSSRGAAKYLKNNQASVQNWVYALLSYYAGLAGAKSVMGEEYIGARKMTLDKQTHWYIIKFLAHRLAFEQAVARNPNPPLLVVEFHEAQGKTLKDIAKERNIDYEDLKDYNKWLEARKVPDDCRSPVLLPMKMGEYEGLIVENNAVENNENIRPWKKKNSLLSLVKPEPKPVLTTQKALFFEWNGIKAIQARKEDNIDRLAMQAGLSKDRFMRYNDLRRFDWIVEGQVYYIQHKKRRARVPFHVVSPGETLWEIAQEYGIKMKHLMNKNRMDKPQKLEPGRVLWMRKTRPADHPIEYKKVGEQPVSEQEQHLNTHEEKGTDLLQHDKDAQPEAETLPKSNEEKVEASIKKMEEAVEQEKKDAFKVLTPGKGNTESQPMATNSAKQPEQKEPAPVELAEVKPQKVEEVAQPQKKELEQPTQRTIKVEPQPVVKKAVPKPAPEAKAKTSEKKQIAEKPKSEPKALPKAKKPEAVVAKAQEKKVSAAKGKEKEKPAIHTVEAGQSLFRISLLYGVKVDDLLAWNHLSSPGLTVGQQLRVAEPAGWQAKQTAQHKAKEEKPASKTAQQLPQAKQAGKVENDDTQNPSIFRYTVKAGDTMYSIARQNGVSVKDLLDWNNKHSPELALGEQLLIKL